MAAMAMKIVCMVLVCMVVATPHVEALTCGQVVSTLMPCLGYLRGSGPLTPGCCSGVRSLNAAAKTTPDRKQACTCLQSASRSYAVNPTNAAGLPGKCGVSIPYKISPTTDCSKVQ